MNEIRRSKRSRKVVLTTLTAAGAAAVSGCGGADWSDNDAQGQVFSSVQECVSAGGDATECQAAYAQALADDPNSAPRFDARDVCEEEFGPGACQQRVASGGTGSVWMPLMAGFVIGNMIGDSDRRHYYAPLYRNRRSGTWYHGGSSYGPLSRGSGGSYAFSRSGFTRPTGAPPVYSRSTVASRGGFGGRSSSSWSGGSRGG